MLSKRCAGSVRCGTAVPLGATNERGREGCYHLSRQTGRGLRLREHGCVMQYDARS